MGDHEVVLWPPHMLTHLKVRPVGSVPMDIARGGEGVPRTLLGKGPGPNRANSSPDGQVHKQRHPGERHVRGKTADQIRFVSVDVAGFGQGDRHFILA